MRNIQADIEFVADVPFNAFVITLCFVVDCTSKLSSHFSLTCTLFFWKGMTNWGPKPSRVNVIFKEILDKVQTGAFLCEVYFMKSHLMDRTSYTVVSSSVHKVFTAATHYQKKNETLVRMPLHELMEQSDSKNSPLIKIVKWSSVKPTMRQFPFSQIN